MRAVVLLLFAVLLMACAGPQLDGESATLRAGVASAIVSPPPGSFIAGDARNRRFAGEHDPLYAKALVLDDAGQRLALVVIDNIGLTLPDIRAIQQRAAAEVPGLPPERILVSSTHTHSGPDVVGLWGEHELSSGRSADYMTFLIETAAAQVAMAAVDLVPVTVRVGSDWVPLDWVRNVTEPRLLDSTLTVVAFEAANGATIATLTNYACHPTVQDAVSDLVSADYVSGFYRRMGEALDGEHLFLQGAIGGWVQPDKRARGFDLADRYGAELADAALALQATATPVTEPRLGFARETFAIPMANPGFLALLEAGVLTRELEAGAVATEVAWFAIGDVQFATHPGETSPLHSRQTRAMLGADHSLILGLTQDALGYILTPEYFDPDTALPSAAYLTATSVGPEAAPRMLEALAHVIARGQSEGRQNMSDTP